MQQSSLYEQINNLIAELPSIVDKNSVEFAYNKGKCEAYCIVLKMLENSKSE